MATRQREIEIQHMSDADLANLAKGSLSGGWGERSSAELASMEMARRQTEREQRDRVEAELKARQDTRRDRGPVDPWRKIRSLSSSEKDALRAAIRAEAIEVLWDEGLI
jgi:hypothetical protein